MDTHVVQIASYLRYSSDTQVEMQVSNWIYSYVSGVHVCGSFVGKMMLGMISL